VRTLVELAEKGRDLIHRRLCLAQHFRRGNCSNSLPEASIVGTVTTSTIVEVCWSGLEAGERVINRVERRGGGPQTFVADEHRAPLPHHTEAVAYLRWPEAATTAALLHLRSCARTALPDDRVDRCGSPPAGGQGVKELVLMSARSPPLRPRNILRQAPPWPTMLRGPRRGGDSHGSGLLTPIPHRPDAPTVLNALAGGDPIVLPYSILPLQTPAIPRCSRAMNPPLAGQRQRGALLDRIRAPRCPRRCCAPPFSRLPGGKPQTQFEHLLGLR